MKAYGLTDADVAKLVDRIAEGQHAEAIREAARAGYKAGFDEACRLMLEHLQRLMEERGNAE